MDEWIVWVIAAVLFAVGEIVNLSFYLLPFAIGSAGAAIVSIAGGGTALSVLVFVILTAILLRAPGTSRRPALLRA